MKELRLDQLRLDGGTQMRTRIDRDVVGEYAQAMQAGAKFPAVQVVWDLTLHCYWLWNGFHRHEAARIAGLKTLYGEVRDGSQREAIYLSLGANRTNGLRPKPEDRRRACFIMLRDPEWCHEPGRKIALHCGVVESSVRVYREEILEELLGTRRGAQLTDREVYRQTGSTVQLIQKVRRRLYPPAEGGDARNAHTTPGASVKTEPTVADMLADLTTYQRAIYDGLPAEKQQAYLELARDRVREDRQKAEARQQQAAAGPVVLGAAEKLQRAEQLGGRWRALLETPRDAAGLRKLDSLVAHCRDRWGQPVDAGQAQAV